MITDLDTGGAERALVNLVTRLDRTRWQPSVICLDKPSDLNAPLVEAGIEVVNLCVDRRRPLQAIFKLAREFRRLRPQLVQSFLFHANLASRLAAVFAGRPPVVCGIRVAEREKAWHLKLDRWTNFLTVGSVCVSEGVKRFSETNGGLPAAKLVVIPNGIDTATYDQSVKLKRDDLGLADSDVVALFVGRLTRQKDVSTLLKASAEVARVDPRFHLVIVGDGPDRAMTEEQACGLFDLTGRVHWLGRRGDIPELLALSDYLVLPSLWEGMPNVVLEAMAARRAVVATNVEGSDELVIPGETGWLVPAGDASALVNAMREACNRENSHTRGVAGRERIEKMFTMDRVVEAYEAVWTRLVNGGKVNGR